MRAAENPFRTERIGALTFRPQGSDWDALMERFEALGRRGAFTGPMGSGKTAALDEIARRLEAQGFCIVRLRVETGRRRLDRGAWAAALSGGAIDPGCAVILDSAEQLGAARWMRFRWQVRRAGAVVVATHRPGRLAQLWTCETSPRLLGEVAGELLAPAPALPAPQIEALWRRHEGNIRHALLELYDLWADGGGES